MRGSVKKRGSSWTAIWDVPNDTGVRRQKSKGGFPTKSSAELFLAKTIHEISVGTWIEPHKATVGEWLDVWLKQYARLRVRESSLRRYAYAVQKTKQEIGSIHLLKITGPRIQQMYEKWIDSGLKGNTVLAIHVMLRNAFAQAEADNLIPRDPTRRLSVPAHKAREANALNDGQIVALLGAAEDTLLYGPLITAVFTGARRGESFGLRWQDVDMEQGIVTIRQQLSADMGLCQTKTARSRRPIPVPPCLIDVFKKQRTKQKEARLALGKAYQDHDLIWCQDNGKPYNYSTVYRAVKRVKDKANLPDFHFHALRHTQATALLESGCNVKVTQERLGHANAGMTLGIYSHVTKTMQDEAVSVLEEKAKKWGVSK